MKFIIPTMDWTEYLAEAIEESQDGDVIVVASEVAKQLGERAKSRTCPDKKITFEIAKAAEEWVEQDDYLDELRSLRE